MNTQTLMICEFCGSAGSPAYAVKLRELTSTLFVCSNCKAAQVFPKFDESELRRLYEADYFHAEPWELNKARILARDYFKKVQRASGGRAFRGKFIEIGAGFGFFARLLEAQTGVEIDLVEPSRLCRKLIEESNFRGRLYESIGDAQSSAAYDGVFCFHVAEHLQRFETFLQQASSLLRIGGHLWLLTPNASSATFAKLRENWGWACIDQHYQFLSQSIPINYFYAAGFTPVVTTDVCPAPIHFPSSWYAGLQSTVESCTIRVANRKGLRQLGWRVVRRTFVEIAKLLEQNRTNWSLCMAERLWVEILGRRPFDELLLVLEKTDPIETRQKQSTVASILPVEI